MLHTTIRSRLLLLFLSTIGLIFIGGCEFPGIVAAKLLPAQTIQPKYAGFQGQSIGVLVWTDRGEQMDFPSLSLDLANSIHKKMLGNTDKPDLKGAIFPVPPASIARYVVDHPDFDNRHITEIAPRFGVTRLVYVEVDDFGTRAPASIELFRGHMECNIQVVEITGDRARVAYQESGIKAYFPPKVPEDGTPDGDDIRFYNGTVDAMSTEVVNRLVAHDAPEE